MTFLHAIDVYHGMLKIDFSPFLRSGVKFAMMDDDNINSSSSVSLKAEIVTAMTQQK